MFLLYKQSPISFCIQVAVGTKGKWFSRSVVLCRCLSYKEENEWWFLFLRDLRPVRARPDVITILQEYEWSVLHLPSQELQRSSQRSSKKWVDCPQGSSGSCCQAWQRKFQSWNPYDRKTHLPLIVLWLPLAYHSVCTHRISKWK